MVSMRWKKPICAPAGLSEVTPTLPLKRFRCSSDWRWPFLVPSWKTVERFVFQHLSPPSDRWCDVLGFVPAGCVLSSSTLQILRGASHLWWLLFPPVYLLGHFLWFRHVQGSTSFDSGMSRAVHLQEVLRVDLMPGCASHSTFHIL